jgi:hypothetical protein
LWRLIIWFLILSLYKFFMELENSYCYFLHLDVLIVSKTPVKIKNLMNFIKYSSQFNNLLMNLLNNHFNILIVWFIQTILINTIVLFWKTSFIIFKKNLFFFFDLFQFINSIYGKLKIVFLKYFIKIKIIEIWNISDQKRVSENKHKNIWGYIAQHYLNHLCFTMININ